MRNGERWDTLSSWGWHRLSLEARSCRDLLCPPELWAVGHPREISSRSSWQISAGHPWAGRGEACEMWGFGSSLLFLHSEPRAVLAVGSETLSGLGCHPEDNSKRNLQETILIFLFDPVPCKDLCLLICVSPFSSTQIIPDPSWTDRTNLQLPAEAQTPQCWDFCTWWSWKMAWINLRGDQRFSEKRSGGRGEADWQWQCLKPSNATLCWKAAESFLADLAQLCWVAPRAVTLLQCCPVCCPCPGSCPVFTSHSPGLTHPFRLWPLLYLCL